MDRHLPRNFRGFNYENSLRNEQLLQMGYEPPPMFSTGTTVVALVFDKGVMLGTDSRATIGSLIMSSASRKIYRLHNNVFCAGSGVAGDLASAARVLEKQLEMLHFNINRRKVRVNCAKHLSKELLAAQKGRLMVSFVIAGVDPTGICLYSVNFDGTSTTVLFVSIGSGHYGAMSILENRWHLDMNECEARQLMVDAISGGINNDLCSGSSLEVLIVRTDYTVERFTETIHNSKRDCKKEVLPPIIGGTSVTHTKFVELEVTDEKVHKLPPIAPSLPLLPIQSNELRLTFDDRRRARKRSASTDLTHSTEKKPRLK